MSCRCNRSTSGRWFYADYANFSLDSEDNKYAIRLSGFSGNAGDSLTNSSGDPNWYLEEWTSQPGITTPTNGQMATAPWSTHQDGGSTFVHVAVLRANTMISSFDGVAWAICRQMADFGQHGWWSKAHEQKTEESETLCNGLSWTFLKVSICRGFSC